jgi:hypothetical protein
LNESGNDRKKKNKSAESNRIDTAHVMSVCIYAGLTIIFLFFLIGAFQFKSPGAARAPIFVSSIGLILLLFQLFKKIKQFKSDKAERSKDKRAKPAITDLVLDRTKKFYFLLSFIVGYIVLLTTIGYFFATGLFVSVTIIVLSDKKERWIFAIGVGTAMAAAMYLIFGTLLKIPLPRPLFW